MHSTEAVRMADRIRDQEMEAAVGLQHAHADRDHALEMLERPSPPRHRLRVTLAHRRSRVHARELLRSARHDIWMHTGALEYAGAGTISEDEFTRDATAVRPQLTADRAAAVLQDTPAHRFARRAVTTGMRARKSRRQ